ncbi:MAG: hypothetical protein ACKOX6_11350 [Bdellovibrio sp.]
MEKELTKDVVVGYANGELYVKAKVAGVVGPFLEDTKSKIMSGEIDLIKGTDIDKEIMLKAIDALSALLSK